MTWTIYTDGAWGHLGAGASTIIHAPSGLRTKYADRLEFQATNNVAEYEGLILGLNKAKALGAKNLIIRTDSQIIAGQVEKEYTTREPELRKYLEVVRALEKGFQGFTLKHIPRAENADVDELVKAAANNLPLPAETFYHVLRTPATKEMMKAFQEVLLTEFVDWKQPIIDSLNNAHHLDDEASAARMVARARSYTIVRGQLYKKGVVQPLLKCISQDKGKELLLEIHAGSCGSHIGLRALSAKAIRHGFYWPTLVRDAEQITKTCEACQNFSPLQARPSTEIQLILLIWPLQRWGMELIGPLPLCKGNRFIVVAIEYFIRWIEAKPLASITSNAVKKFF
jgi:ribonuclease HI